jgi:hypothetical protein
MREMQMIQDLWVSQPPPDPGQLPALRARVVAAMEDSAAVHQRPSRAAWLGPSMRWHALGPSAARRRRRPLVLSGVATAAVAVAASVLLLVAGWPGGGQTPAAVHVNLAAWSVNTNPDGTVTFKLKKLADPTRLEHVLAAAGVPAIVRWGENCREQQRIVGAPAARAFSERYVGHHGRFQWADGQPLPAYAYTITPSAMPKGARFVISAGPLPAFEQHNRHYVGPWIDWALVPAGAKVTCGPSVPPEVG